MEQEESVKTMPSTILMPRGMSYEQYQEFQNNVHSENTMW